MPVDQQNHWFPPTTVNPAELRTPHPPEYTYQNPLPEATTLTPGELLIKHYGDRSAARDWTDPNGLLRKQQDMYRDHPEHAVLPIGSPGLVGDWPRPGDLPMVPVPVYETRPSANPKDAIEFNNHVWSWPKLGISISDILGGSSESLEKPDDVVLKKYQGKDLDFVISWPGYKSQRSRIRTKLDNGGPITRLNLLIQIAMAYAAFFKKVADKCLLPDTLGFYNIALHQGKDARKDSLGLQLTQLRFIKFYPTSNGYFIVEVYIV